VRSQFPTLEQVEAADVEQVLRWNRKLPNCESDAELEVVNRNFQRLGELQKADPEAFTAASKAVGW
jgi:hypothetical protein